MRGPARGLAYFWSLPTLPVPRTNVYVDGFNLYYGAVKGTAYRWLDLRKLSQGLLKPEHEINRIRYFTARIAASTSDPTAPDRQATYLRALQHSRT